MPHLILKRVVEYCTYSKKYFVFIFALLVISSWLQNYVYNSGKIEEVFALQILVTISLSGYGMLITKSRINNAKGLPKINIKKIIVLGIKSTIVMACYLFIQVFILEFASMIFDFPLFDLKELLLDLPNTVNMFIHNDPVNSIIFLSVGAALFYITAFFMEIALAKLADTNSILSAFNLLSIKRSIDVIGWRNYAKEYTMIVLVIVILSYIVAYDLDIAFIDSIKDIIFSFLIFATQYLGIGAVYAKVKDLKYNEIQVS